MPEKDKKLTEILVEASRALPADKKEFLFGFAEGVAAMAAKVAAEEGAQQDSA